MCDLLAASTDADAGHLLAAANASLSLSLGDTPASASAVPAASCFSVANRVVAAANHLLGLEGDQRLDDVDVVIALVVFFVLVEETLRRLILCCCLSHGGRTRPRLREGEVPAPPSAEQVCILADDAQAEQGLYVDPPCRRPRGSSECECDCESDDECRV